MKIRAAIAVAAGVVVLGIGLATHRGLLEVAGPAVMIIAGARYVRELRAGTGRGDTGSRT